MTAGQIPASRSATAAPPMRLRTATYSPFSVVMRYTSSTLTPLVRAKPSRALVGVPSAAKATRTGGPATSSSRSCCTGFTSSMMTMARRGVLMVRRAPCSTLASCRAAVKRAASSASSPAKKRAGSSSLPISSTKVAMPYLASVLSIGYPSSSRWATYSLATPAARARTRPIYPARSVMEMAPRASSRLKVWEHLRQ